MQEILKRASEEKGLSESKIIEWLLKNAVKLVPIFCLLLTLGCGDDRKLPCENDVINGSFKSENDSLSLSPNCSGSFKKCGQFQYTILSDSIDILFASPSDYCQLNSHVECAISTNDKSLALICDGKLLAFDKLQTSEPK